MLSKRFYDQIILIEINVIVVHKNLNLNFVSMIHKVVNSLDQNYGNSTLELCDSVGAPVVEGSRVVHHLNNSKMCKMILK